MSGVCCHSADSILGLPKEELHQLGLFAYSPCPSPAPHWRSQCSWPQIPAICILLPRGISEISYTIGSKGMRERICRATCTSQFFSTPQSQSAIELLSALISLFSADYNKRTNSRDSSTLQF